MVIDVISEFLLLEFFVTVRRIFLHFLQKIFQIIFTIEFLPILVHQKVIDLFYKWNFTVFGAPYKN